MLNKSLLNFIFSSQFDVRVVVNAQPSHVSLLPLSISLLSCDSATDCLPYLLRGGKVRRASSAFKFQIILLLLDKIIEILVRKHSCCYLLLT